VIHTFTFVILYCEYLEYAISKIQGIEQLKLIETPQLLVCAGDDNILGVNVNIIKGNTEVM
jgi:hypothetical protein